MQNLKIIEFFTVLSKNNVVCCTRARRNQRTAKEINVCEYPPNLHEICTNMRYQEMRYICP